MSGFNTIKKSRKRSHEIDEKLNVLNRELEKTKNIQEQPTMNTGDLYTKVQQQVLTGTNQSVMVKMVELLDQFQILFHS